MSNTGADPLSEIIDAAAAVAQTAIDAAAAALGDKPIVFVELIGDPNKYPALLFVPRNTTVPTRSSRTRTQRHVIDMILLFGRGSEKYASRAQRLWVPVLMNAFDQHMKLNDDSVQLAEIENVNYDPVLIGQVPYIAVTFQIVAVTNEAFSFGA